MANNKVGFQYYSVVTDRYQDIKIKRLKKTFGCYGIAVYDYILCEIYRVKGCFIEWDESTAFDVADYFQIKESLVDEIVNYCCVVGLFNRELLTNERVLTSEAIQQRFLDWSKKAKRINPKIPERIKILPEEPANLPEECTQTSGSLPQSKVKKSKVKKRKEKKRKEKEEDPPPPKLMKDFDLSCCKLEKDSVGFRVMEASVKLYQGFCKAFPTNRDLPEIKMEYWVPPVRELIEKKGYTYQQISEVINWVLEDKFWKSKILDTKALAEKFERLKIEYQKT